MSKRIYPSWLPRLSTPVVKDAADDLRALRGDYNGGAFAGYAGSFAAVVREKVVVSATAADPDEVFTTAVPAGYLHVIQRVSCRQDSGGSPLVVLYLISGAGAYELVSAGALAPQNTLTADYELVLQAGEQLRFSVYGIVWPTSIVISAVGYSVQL